MRNEKKMLLFISIIMLMFGGCINKSNDLVETEEAIAKYKIEILSITNGGISLEPTKELYKEGEEVKIILIPDLGYVFKNWLGQNGTEITKENTLLMNGSKKVGAEFQKYIKTYKVELLTVTNGGISLEPKKDLYEEGEEIKVVLSIETGYRFKNWLGKNGNEITKENVLLMNGTKEIGVEYEEIPKYKVEMLTATNGGISLEPTKDLYEEGEEVKVVLSIETGYRFKNWLGQNGIEIKIGNMLLVNGIKEIGVEYEKIPLENLLKTNDYIDIDSSSVKFLFKSTLGNKIEFFIGEKEEYLELKKIKENYQNNGLIIENLVPNKKYFYKIKSSNAGATEITDVLSFNKLENTDNWEPTKWAKETIFYEVFVRTFFDKNGDGVGDFNGLKEKIPYFKELGVEALWLMPINDSPSYHGYDVVNYYETEPDYGTKEEFLEFLEMAHDNDIKVIMDLVVNHSSDKNNWFINSWENKDSEYRDYYVWKDKFDSLNERGSWGQKIWHLKNGEYYTGLFYYGMPDLNYRNPRVREEMKKVAQYWLDPNEDGDFSDGVDGYRLDAALLIDDKDMEVTHNFWQEFNSSVKSVNPEAFLVGENWTTPEKIATFFKDLDSSFNFNLADKVVDMASGKEIDILSEMRGIYDIYGQYTDNMIDSTFLTNHDQDRVGSVLGDNNDKKKLAGSLLLTLPGTPFIYYGEELGQLGGKVEDKIREPFDWYASGSGDGMTKGVSYNSIAYTKTNDGISLEEERKNSLSVFKRYKKLIEIRKNNKALFDIQNYQKMSTPNNMYGYKVEEEDYNLFVIHNLTDISRIINLDKLATELINGIEVSGDIEVSGYETLILKSAISELIVTGSDIEIQKVTIRVTVPASGTDGEQIYLLGNINNWTVAENYKLKNIGNDIYEIVIDQNTGNDLIFKFRLDLGTYEDTSSRTGSGFTGDDYNNRIYEYKSESETINLEITEWLN